MREMSVTEFFREFGGSSLGNVRWHFQTLAEHGWLRKVRTKNIGRGRPQTVYRATELAFYDDECAAELPISVRAAFSTRILEQMGERIADAKRASTIDSKEDRYLSLDSLILDDEGWSEAIEVLNACFRSMAQEQTDAKVRMVASGDPSTLMMVTIAGFESPMVGRSGLTGVLPPPVMEMDMGMPLETRLAKVFGDPVNIRIVSELNRAAMSPSELSQRLHGMPVPQLDRKCKHLEKYGWIARVDEKTGGMRRGSREVFYRATSPQAGTDLWSDSARLSKGGASAETLSRFYGRVTEAITAGTLDSRHDRHLTWSALLLDDLGWKQVIQTLALQEARLTQVRQKASQRLRNGDSSKIGMTCFLAGFEIPPLGSATS